MKRATLALAAFAVAAFFAPAWTPHNGAAVAATPTPVALQYDEINRGVIAPATPPAPDSWPADYNTIMASAQGSASGAASPAPQQGLGSLLGHMMGGNAPGGAMGGMMAMMRTGHLVRYTYYKGWIRTDDPVAQTATIEKCDQHQYITLDLAKKTYTITNTQPACPTTPAMPMGSTRPSTPSQPGTVDMTVKGSAQNLGPLKIDGIDTSGSDRSMEMSMTNATGSCHDGDFGMKMMQYVSSIGVPRPYCPLPHTMSSPSEMMAGGQGGCKPTMHVQTQGIGLSENVNGRLVLYSRMEMMSQAHANGMGMSMVIERGNVKWLSGAPADALFTVPPGFTKAQ